MNRNMRKIAWAILFAWHHKKSAFIVLMAAIMFIFSCRSYSQDYGPYSAEVVRIIDGDTIAVKVDLWPGLSKVVNLRLRGVNTPEKRTKRECEKIAATKAYNFTELWLLDAGKITVTNISLGKWAGRAVGDIHNKNWESLSSALIHSKNGREYNGEKRKPWC